MKSSIASRAGRSLLTLFSVFVIAFLLTQVAYRNPAATLAPRNATQEALDAVARQYNLDQPWYVQLWYYLVQGPPIQGTPTGLLNWPPSLGYSFKESRPVTELILEKFPVTISLAVGALVLWLLFSIVAGVLAAWKPGKAFDVLSSTASFIGLSIPTFLGGILLLYFLYYTLSMNGFDFFPGGGYVSLREDPAEWARHLLLPWATLLIVQVAAFQRIVRSSMLEVLGADYIRTARAKGVPERRVLFSHSLSAALNPIITLGGLEFASILGGAIVTEQIFGLDGVGRLALSAATGGDFPVVLGVALLSAAVFVAVNFVVDIITHWRDPFGATG
ncbi:ABC transporter permease [Arthrobacter ginkgonis]|uniref:ABC transporter permease n=1 Tax=Arthrobacter ginkgonis TaxID=1630594 RepID=A0ABP7C8J7_9MICC